MAYKNFDGLGQATGEQSNITKLQATGDMLELPHESFVRDADITRDGVDLVLDGPQGQVIVEDYFAAMDAPTLTAPGGATLTPELVESFARSGPEYAQSMSMNDASPVGAVSEISGDATVTRTDGSTQTLHSGMDIYQGDIIETGTDGAVNIGFNDDSSFAVSEDTRLAIDEYVYDPATESGAQNFSVLKGVFVFTSGLIGRDDPDDVEIDTPMGSIGIRGTIIAGDANDGEITVVEGAIVLRDPMGGEMTLANQYETAKFSTDGGSIQNMGQMSPQDVMQKFSGVSKVSPSLFSSVNDTAQEQAADDAAAEQQQESQQDSQEQQTDEAPDGEQTQEFEADGATDQNGDNEVDGTVEEGEAQENGEAQQTQEGTEQTQETSAEETTTEDTKPKAQTTTKFGNDSSGMESTSTTSDGTKATMLDTQSADKLTKTVTLDGSPDGTKTAPRETVKEPLNDSSTSNNDTNIDPSLLNTEQAPPPPPPEFDVRVEWRTDVNELIGNSTAGAPIELGTFRALNTDSISAPTLSGADASHLSIATTSDPLVYKILLNTGEGLDFEDLHNNQIDITLNATSINGDTVTKNIKPLVNDVNEPVTPLSLSNEGVSTEYFEASNGNQWTFDFKEIFADQDLAPGGINEALTFSLSTTTENFLNTGTTLIDNWNLDSATGILTINFLDDLTEWNSYSDSNFNIDVTATDSYGYQGGHSIGFTLDAGTVYNISGDINSATSGDTFSTNTASTFGIGTAGNASNINVFTGNGSDTVELGMLSSYVLLNTGNDSDTVLANMSSDNTIITGYGNDYVTLDNADSTAVYAMQGNDEIILTSGQISGMDGSSYTGITLDGGNDTGKIHDGNGDKLVLEMGNGQTIDFGNFGTGNAIRNIEIVDIDNSSVANTVTLNYDDVIAMTDERNTLVLDTDTNDTVNFDALGHGDAVADGAMNINGETYDVYHFDDVTLLVDQEAAAVNVTA